MSLERTFLM